MAISAVNMFWLDRSSVNTGQSGGPTIPIAVNNTGASPTGTYGGSSEFQSIVAGKSGDVMYGFALPILDGSTLTYTLNWVDGTVTLRFPPTMVIGFRQDPPAWAGSSATTAPPYPDPLYAYYGSGSVVEGSSHVQQAQNTGKAGTSAPTWSTSGGTVVDGGITWKDLGASATATAAVSSVTGITTTGATVTFTGAGTNAQVAMHTFALIF